MVNRQNLLFLLALLASTSAFADCAQRIDALDQRVKATPPDERVAPLVAQVRERAISLCRNGNDAAATQTVQMLERMLPKPQAESPAGSAEPEGPYLNDVDYTRGHQPIQRDYLNPWDALSGKQICDWLSASEIEQALGLAVELKTRRAIWECQYRFLMPNGRIARAFSLYVEPHDDPDYPRQSEARVSTGSASLQFERIDSGTPMLNAYENMYGAYIAVYPVGGMTMWKLDFLKDSPQKDFMFGNAPQPAHLGKAFLDLLIEKHGQSIESGN